MSERPQSLGEEIANSLSHGLALVAAIAGAPFLILTARGFGAAHLVGVCVFAVTMILLYLSSTLYHATRPGRLKSLFRKFDHSAIYVFIAGSYTAFALGALGGAWGWALFCLVWVLAVAGIVLNTFNLLTHRWLSTGLYLAMGWLVLIAAVPLVQRVPLSGIGLLVAGGFAYTAGVAFFMLDSRLRYAHAIWHGFVPTGTVCHFFAVLNYAA